MVSPSVSVVYQAERQQIGHLSNDQTAAVKVIRALEYLPGTETTGLGVIGPTTWGRKPRNPRRTRKWLLIRQSRLLLRRKVLRL